MIAMMIRFAILGALAVLLVPSAYAAGGGGGGGGGGGSNDPYGSSYATPSTAQPTYPKRSGTKSGQKAKKPQDHSSIGDPALRQAIASPMTRSTSATTYAAAISQLKTLGHDDHPNVANLIGYSYRKLGDYEQSQVWYERALKADPNHVLTWQYYGLLAARARQPRAGALSSEPDCRHLRHELRRVQVTGRCAGEADRHGARLLGQGRADSPGFMPGKVTSPENFSIVPFGGANGTSARR